MLNTDAAYLSGGLRRAELSRWTLRYAGFGDDVSATWREVLCGATAPLCGHTQNGRLFLLS